MNEYNDYIVSYQIIYEVLSGKNLNDVFNKKTKNLTININKVKDISFGVIRYYFVLIKYIQNLTRTLPQKEIAIILLIAIYEIKYSKKPIYAVTNDSVELSYKLIKNSKIKNFINAVIRNFIRNKTYLENKLIDNVEYKYNFPIWMLNKIKQEYPDNWQNIVIDSNSKPKTSLRVNLNKISVDNYLILLRDDNIDYKLIDNIIVLDKTIPVKNIPYFAEGYVSVQDINAQKLKNIIQFEDNQYILDACSAPGGKTCQILENNKVKLLALDIDENRLIKVRENLIRLNLDANILCADASNCNWWDNKEFDIIIADVPCSATGTLKKNPDIKLHRQLADIKNFVITQRKIISNLWTILKNNGYIVYITCSIFREENQDNIEFFKQNLSNIRIIKELQLVPDENSDGFYYCLLKKTNDSK